MIAMTRDAVWQAIDHERLGLADLLDDLGPDEWDAPSLCAGWRVRDVAAHLTLAHLGLFPAVVALARARGGFDRMIHDTAVREAGRPEAEFAPRLRAMAGSRRKAPGVSHLEPLLDVLVHGQDIARPLGRTRPMPVEAAATAAQRAWSMGFPFHARRRLAGLRLAASDCDWSAGSGEPLEGPVSALLLLVTGRTAALGQLSGPGLAVLRERLPDAVGGGR
ncbi:maleylpyruvate isomerase family mycothiol-dependent enzyme [Streptomyces sp. NPDC091268]|uniref:maleylpyruvate isomerase family mycothiol-dependent enzyme n=1 Tax=Streptomyces sp. NPDC091268 TaxID=3365979 RepID=UPI00381293D6